MTKSNEYPNNLEEIYQDVLYRSKGDHDIMYYRRIINKERYIHVQNNQSNVKIPS